jgi:hypothetical protein
MKIAFNPRYCCWTLFLLMVEILIGTFVRDSFVRPFIGDVRAAALGVLAFACAVEVLQYFKLVNLLGWQQHKLLVIILGATFDWHDILAYVIGAAAILWLDR